MSRALPRVAALAAAAVALAVACSPTPEIDATPTFPAEVEGLPVLTVTRAIEARESGRPGPHAVAGWFSQAPAHSCPAALDPATGAFRNRSPLELDCHLGDWGLTELPEAVVDVRIQRGGGTVSVQVTRRSVRGPWLQPVLDLGESIFPAGWAETWRPVPVVLIGHFDDARAIDCPVAERRECSKRFVATSLAWP